MSGKTLYMMTSSNWNIFRVTGPLCGEFTGPGEFPTQRPVTRSFDVFFDLRLNKRLSKHSWGWWFETLSWSLWRHHNDFHRRSYCMASPIFHVISAWWCLYVSQAGQYCFGVRFFASSVTTHCLGECWLNLHLNSQKINFREMSINKQNLHFKKCIWKCRF